MSICWCYFLQLFLDEALLQDLTLHSLSMGTTAVMPFASVRECCIGDMSEYKLEIAVFVVGGFKQRSV